MENGSFLTKEPKHLSCDVIRIRLWLAVLVKVFGGAVQVEEFGALFSSSVVSIANIYASTWIRAVDLDAVDFEPWWLVMDLSPLALFLRSRHAHEVCKVSLESFATIARKTFLLLQHSAHGSTELEEVKYLAVPPTPGNPN